MQMLQLDVPPFPLLAAVGQTVWPPGITHAERCFEAYDLILCSKGMLYMEENGVRYEVGEGQMLILEPGKHHRGYRPTESETEVYWIHFRYPQGEGARVLDPDSQWQTRLQRTDQDIEPPTGAVNIPKYADVDMGTVLPLINELLDLHNTLTYSRTYELQIGFGKLLIALQNGLREGGPLPLSYRLSEKVAAYLAEGLEKPFNSAEMERDLHYHFDYLARCLKKHTGMSPIAFRHHLQIERAKRLLAYTDHSLVRVGEMCGFRDPNYFTRLFKRAAAMTPGAYRNRYQIFRSNSNT
ncbi:AraC family transcriptional regulator [Paenibacillus physcomitrellae]|uniref:HTH-type transcriptional regulator YisR n=1 Tax=Paenibacillus physcomitrellae TaxID=1619311 RepID=A0ABQ1FQP6_9BACL|nr:AraC family transcriptional regulator [Paenibacillus physcomitrellae]GGA24454.1 putative HTH-type transcriptional regulator YisR [Paenibacillus physcomitrellae]